MYDLLIAGAFDLSGEGWPHGDLERFAGALLLGRAGDVRHGQAADATLAARSIRVGGSRPPRLRPAAWQPGPDGVFTLLAGRLFDQQDLARRYGLDPSLGDSALYAALRRKVGEDCDRWIDGDYAVIEWFPRERRVRLARAPLGQYPLHVWRAGSRVAVASIARPLFALGASSAIDDDYLADIMVFNLENNERCWYRDLSPSPSATITDIDRQGRRGRQYWSVDTVPSVRFARDEDYVEAADELFRRSVRATLADIKRPALFLSGGLDSQATASYLVEELPAGQPIPCYTSVPLPGIVPDLKPSYLMDESSHVRALVAMYPQLKPEFIDGADSDYDHGLDEYMLVGDWPIHNQFNAHWGHEGLRRARRAGCDVILSAGGGNPGFSYDGVTGYATWLRSFQWGRLAREVARLDDDERPFFRRLFHHAVRPNLPNSLNDLIDRTRGYSLMQFGNWCALRPDWIRENGVIERARAMGAKIEPRRLSSSRAWRASSLANMQVETPELRTSSALMYGLEERDTTVYRPLMDFCIGVPDEQYLRDGEDRWLARRMLKGRVPEMVRTERRSGLQSGDWAVRLERERPRMMAELESLARDPRLARMFDLEGLRSDLAAWEGPAAPQMPVIGRLQWGLGRCLSTARFVRFAEGRNAG